jgi:hypothetical protein
MDGFLFLAILVLLASVAVIVGTVVFFVWAAQYFGRRAYRQATRRHLYVPVGARVTRVLYQGRGTVVATLYVEYEFGGTTIWTRFMTTRAVARLAEQSKRVALQIDPDHPKDVVVDPAFEAQAAAAPEPPGRGTPLGARSFSGYALRLLACLLLGGVLAVGLGRLRRGAVDPLVVVIVAVLVAFTGLLLAASRFKPRDGHSLGQSEAEKSEARRGSV